LALDDGECLSQSLALFISGKKTPYPLNTSLGGPEDRSGCCAEGKSLLLLPGFGPRTVQFVA